MPRDEEISTDRIERVVGRVLAGRPSSPALPPDCTEVHRIEALERTVTDHETRIRHNEDALADGKTAFAVLQTNSDHMKISLDKINGSLSRLTWIILSAVVTGVLATLFKVIP